MTDAPFTEAEETAGAFGDGDAAAAGSTAAAAASPLARLRHAYDARRRSAELFLPVPGWEETSLVARVVVPDEDFLRRLTTSPGTVDWMADFVALTVAGLFEVDGEGEDPQLTPVEGPAGVLRFDARFGDAIGAPDVNSPRAAVLAAFTVGGSDGYPVVNVVALADFANKIEHWLADTSREIAEAIVPGP